MLMEEHRLTDMPPNYDRKLFEKLFNDTKNLRNKLSYGIDPRRYGVEQEDIVSWFTVKFIFIFSKYYGKVDNNILKGKIIQGLQFYKNRILRYSYTKKNSVNQTCDISEFYNIESTEVTTIEEVKEEDSIEKLIPIFKSKLDPLAFHVFTIDYNPPLYILIKLDCKESRKKIPDNLIGSYMGIGNNNKAYQEIHNARKRYRKLISLIKK